MTGKIVHSVFFSPTGTTQTAIRAVGRGTGRAHGQTVDLTLGSPAESTQFSHDDLVVVGMPVYSGRLPSLAVERFRTMAGEGAAVVPIVVYGNRAYDDALVELSDLCAAQEFRVVAAGSFIGEHSFSSEEFPIAPGRPDQKDIRHAEAFGGQVAQLLEGGESALMLELGGLPGNRPYKPGMQAVPLATDTDPQACTRCGTCIECCPTQGIRMVDGLPVTAADSCIWCLACVRNCPTNARRISLAKISDISLRLHTTCKERQEPECFLGNRGQS